jgi:NADH-quinone oxidoreductase subunit A
MSASLGIVAYLALFTGVGLLFIFVNLLVGRFLRPSDPHAEKLEIYECGEPTIGSSFVQFDLRFYVVALLFIIFDVEVAFFFPWATVFGKTTQLMEMQEQAVMATADGKPALSPDAKALYQELGVRNPTALQTAQAVHDGAKKLAWIAMVDIGVFFVVLMVGFAYVWKRGDLDWVRAIGGERAAAAERVRRGQPAKREPVLLA